MDFAIVWPGTAIAPKEYPTEESDEKLFDLFDAEGAQLESSGSRRGRITGSFFHFVDRLSL
jgi:hypothetical protein